MASDNEFETIVAATKASDNEFETFVVATKGSNRFFAPVTGTRWPLKLCLLAVIIIYVGSILSRYDINLDSPLQITRVEEDIIVVTGSRRCHGTGDNIKVTRTAAGGVAQVTGAGSSQIGEHIVYRDCGASIEKSFY
jgi:hypothetical protein